MREFGELLRTHRIHAGLTQQQLADFAMLSVRAIRDLECGRTRSPRAETVRLLADGLRLDDASRADLQQAGGRPARRVRWPRPHRRRRSSGRGGEARAALTDRRPSGALPAAGHRSRASAASARPGSPWRSRASCTSGTAGRSCGTRPRARRRSTTHQDTVLVTDHRPDPRLLETHPRLRIVVTALAPTGLPGEHVFPLGALADDAAVRVLLTHVHRVRPAFRPEPANQAALIGLVHELDGLPSALEFAAGWFMVYSPQHLLERLRSNPLDPTSAHLRDSLRRSLSTLDERVRGTAGADGRPDRRRRAWPSTCGARAERARTRPSRWTPVRGAQPRARGGAGTECQGHTSREGWP